jgi:hypothetical protein
MAAPTASCSAAGVEEAAVEGRLEEMRAVAASVQVEVQWEGAVVLFADRFGNGLNLR